jgi:uncharacterized membrane protein
MTTSRRLLLATAALTLLVVAAYLAAWSRGGPRSFRGQLLLTTDPWTFTQCDSARAWRVVDATGGNLREIMKRFVPPEEPVYLEVQARGLPSARLGIVDVRYAARETRGCRDNLRGIILRALGTEPFWAVTITAQEIRFEAPDDPGRVVFPAVRTQRVRERQVYRVRNDRGDALEVTVREQSCSDGMSDAYYALAVEVQINGRAYSGCGRPGWTE